MIKSAFKKVFDTILSNKNFLLIKIIQWIRYTGRLFKIAVIKFHHDDCFAKASSLSYVTILSVVPVVILIFAVFTSYSSTKDIFLNIVQHNIIHFFIPGEEIGSALGEYLNKFSANITKISSILGSLLLVIAAIDIVLIIEKSMNSIWQVKKGRTIIQNFLIYWTTLTIGPLFLVLSFYVTSQVGQVFLFGKVFSNIFFPLFVTWFGFFLAYIFIPRTKVSVKSASIGALVAGIFWELGKYGFGIYVSVIGTKTLGVIYGNLYIIPIFIAWIYLSYAILLFGVEISYLIQYPELYKRKNNKRLNYKHFKLYFLLNSIFHIFDYFQKGSGGISLEELASKNGITRDDMMDYISQAVNKRYVKEIENYSGITYIPNKPLEQIHIMDVVSMAIQDEQELLNENYPIVTAMFNEIMCKLKSGMEKEFGQQTLKDFLDYETHTHELINK